MNFGEFVEKHEIEMTVEDADSNPNMDSDPKWRANHYLCTLVVGGKRMEVPFSQGTGIKGPPTVDGVLECLASDCRYVEDVDSFEEWAENIGFDTDSRRAERTFRECVDQVRELSFLLGGAAYTELLNEVEED